MWTKIKEFLYMAFCIIVIGFQYALVEFTLILLFIFFAVVGFTNVIGWVLGYGTP